MYYSAYEKYYEALKLNRILLATLESESVPAAQKELVTVQWKHLDQGFMRYVSPYKGDQWGYDDSWILYNKDPRDQIFFNKHLFPRDWFKAEQAYVAGALSAKPPASASIQDKALWAIDIMFHINSGLLATNLAAEALGDLTLINQITSVRSQQDVTTLSDALGNPRRGGGIYNEHPVWAYAWDFWDVYADRGGIGTGIVMHSVEDVQPMMCAEFSDLLFPPAACSSDMLNALYWSSRTIRGEMRPPNMSPSPVRLPSYSWQTGQRDLVQTMPWNKNGLFVPGISIINRLYGDDSVAVAALTAEQKTWSEAMKQAAKQWSFLNIYRLDPWYMGKHERWKRATSDYIPELRRFRTLANFLESLSVRPSLVEKQIPSADGSSMQSVHVPNFALLYQRGGIDAWARYFTKLRYKDYIKAGIYAWGDNLGSYVLSAYDMNRAIDEGWAPNVQAASAEKVAAYLGVEGAGVAMGSFAAGAALGPAGVIAASAGILMNLFSKLASVKKRRHKLKQMMQERRRGIIERYNVIEQPFIRSIRERLDATGYNPYQQW